MAQPYKKRKYGEKYAVQPMAIDRPRFKPRYNRSTIEKKWFDTAISSTTMDSAGTLLSSSLNLVNEGNDVNEMAGRKLVITRVQLRITFQADSDSNATLASLNTSPEFRLFLVLDKQCNGATVSTASIFQNTDIRTYNNLSSSSRFKILKEEHGVIETYPIFNTNTLVYAAAENRKACTVYLKCFIPVMFSPQAGASRVIGEVISNNLVLCGFSTGSLVSASIRARIRFQDN